MIIRINKNTKYLFYFAYALILITSIFESTQWGYNSHFYQIVIPIQYLAILILLMLFLFVKKYKFSTFFFGLLIFGISVLTMYGSRRFITVVLFMLFTFLAIQFDEQEYFKVYLAVVIGTVLLILCLYFTGFFYNDYVIRLGGRRRLYFGFTYTTFITNFFFHITVAYFYIKKHYINVTETLVILIINQILFYYTDTKAVYYEVFLLLGMLWIIRFRPRIMSYKIVEVLSSFLMPVLAIIIYFLSANYYRFPFLDTVLTNRLRMGGQAISRYGIHPFGTYTQWATGRYGIERFVDYFYVDSSYLNILLSFGYIILLVILVGYFFLIREKFFRKQCNACIVIILLAIHSFSDPQLFELRYNPMLLSLGGAIVRAMAHVSIQGYKIRIKKRPKVRN